MISLKNLILFSLFIQFFNCDEFNQISVITKDNLLIINHEVTIHENEMSSELEGNIIAHSASALDRISDDKKAKEDIKMFMEKEYNGTWLVIVSNFTPYIEIPHINGTYISFSYKERTVAALKTKLVNLLTI